MDGERPMENSTASTIQSTMRSKRRSVGCIWQTTRRTNEGWVHCDVDLLETSEGADDRAVILVEHGGRVSREDVGDRGLGEGFIWLGEGHRSIDRDSVAWNSMSSIMEPREIAVE